MKMSLFFVKKFGRLKNNPYLCKVNLKQQAMKSLFNKIKDAKRIGLYMKWFNNKQIKIY